MKIAQHPVVNHYCDVERALTNLAETRYLLDFVVLVRVLHLATQALQSMGFEKVLFNARWYASLAGSRFSRQFLLQDDTKLRNC